MLPDISEWQPLLCLDPFDLGGDDVSQRLFGLGKNAVEPGLYAGRGVPEDCTRVVRQDVAANEEHIQRYGEGDHGHTFASLEEVLMALKSADAPDLGESEWARVLSAVGYAREQAHEPSFCRFVVWGNW